MRSEETYWLEQFACFLSSRSRLYMFSSSFVIDPNMTQHLLFSSFSPTSSHSLASIWVWSIQEWVKWRLQCKNSGRDVKTHRNNDNYSRIVMAWVRWVVYMSRWARENKDNNTAFLQSRTAPHFEYKASRETVLVAAEIGNVIRQKSTRPPGCDTGAWIQPSSPDSKQR